MEEQYMERALQLAIKGEGRVSPNPLVGAVIVKNGRVIGEGYHETYGGLHAERNALKNCNEDPKGADLYVTLEPCCHQGKQPPCVDAVIKAGIKRVYVGCVDPNPKVAGKGIEILRNNGIEVVEHVLETECRAINEIFFHYIETKTPFVILKYAMTMDGKIATATGKSKWITGDEARENVHRTRNRCSAIMTGIGTVLKDNPMLNCRIENGKNPIRIICDTNLRIPMDSNIVKSAFEIKTILATASQDGEKRKQLEKAGCLLWDINKKDKHIDLTELMKRLGKEGIDSVLLEGGEQLNWSMIESGLVQKVHTYIAPKLFGGKNAKVPIGGNGYQNPIESVRLKNSVVTKIGNDYLIESDVAN